MTRRERLERKLEKRHEWAEKRKQEAERRFNAASKDAEAFYGGQPILVGHHSEGKARRLQAKIHNNSFAGVDNLNMAKHHESKAAGLETYLDTVIFDDDPDAIEKMEAKIFALESRQTMMAEENKACRKQKIAAKFQAFELKNNNANLRRCKDRLATLKGVKSLKERAEKSASGVIIDQLYAGKKARITFAEKPDREIINALKEAGFRWCKCCWIGDSDKVPQAVKDMESVK